MVKLLRHDLHILTGAYALDALEGAERDRFEHHRPRCPPCAHEVGGFRETATRLAMAVSVAPPPRLRARVLAAVARTRQVPPAVDQQPRPARRAAWVPRLAAAAAVVGIVAAAVFGVAQVTTQHKLDRAQAGNRAVTAVLAAPDARIMRQPTSAGGAATVVVPPSRGEMIFSTAGLPALPAAKVYELWLMGPPRTRPAGLLAAEAGRTTPVVPVPGRSGCHGHRLRQYRALFAGQMRDVGDGEHRCGHSEQGDGRQRDRDECKSQPQAERTRAAWPVRRRRRPADVRPGDDVRPDG